MIEEILPYNMEEKYNYMVIDNMYIAHWYVKNYLSGVSILSTLNSLLSIPNAMTCFNVRKINSIEFLKKINNRLAVCRAEKSTKGAEQIDIDILNKYINDAKEIRYIVQVENEDLFEVSVQLQFTSDSIQDMEKNCKKIQDTMYSSGISMYPMNFNQYDAYKQHLPIFTSDYAIHDKICKIFTTSSLTSLFPFYTNNFIELEGIRLGEFRERICMIDFRKKELNNKNMLIVGSSGTGKSFLVKNMMLQYLYKGIKQIVIDPEGEYVQIASALGQRVITKSTFNIMEIEEQFVKSYPNDYINKKIDNLVNMLELNQILEDNEKIESIKTKIKEIYHEYGITENINSLYMQENGEKIYTCKKYINKLMFPTINTLKEKIPSIKLSSTEKKNIIRQIDSYKCSDVQDCEEDLVVYNLETCDEKYINALMYKLQEYLSPEHIIYIDEMWKLMCNKNVSLELVNLFKTIRKRGTSLVAITQDISDIVTYNDGDFGKSIFNNSYTKVFFKMEYLDVENLQKMILEPKDFFERVMKLKRGSALLEQGGALIELDVIAFPQDKEIIEGGIK